MSSIEIQIARIQAFMKLPGWSKWKLGKEAKLGAQTMRDADKKNWNPDTSTLQACVNVVDQKIAELKKQIEKFDLIGAKK